QYADLTYRDIIDYYRSPLAPWFGRDRIYFQLKEPCLGPLSELFPELNDAEFHETSKNSFGESFYVILADKSKKSTQEAVETLMRHPNVRYIPGYRTYFDANYEPGEVIFELKEPHLGSISELFPELDIAEVEDMEKSIYETLKGSWRISDEKLEELKSKFGTLFYIKLADRSKESAVEAAKILMQYPNVAYAELNYIDYPEDSLLYRFHLNILSGNNEQREETVDEGTTAPAPPDSVHRFADVQPTDWFYGAVAYMFGMGFMNGTSDNSFTPNGTTTRGMIFTILHRLAARTGPFAAAGDQKAEVSPATNTTYPVPVPDFIDTSARQWYTNAVEWAYRNGIVGGYSDGTLGPEDNITREQLVTVLYRYARWKGLDVGAAADLSQFSDAGSVSDWALVAMQWAVAEGLLSGRTQGKLAPGGTATRAEVATLIMRFVL
ncbi:MAG: S-layer homology domain-containing protein, partial [Oscillospiraceae bacterium]|nr:S-layer homology domain-containing protein [Oscillospiraceae bacterium]